MSGAVVAAMAPAAAGTLVVVGIMVAVIVAYLTIVLSILVRVSFILGTVLIGVRSIANQVEPVGPVVGDIAANVTAINEALAGVLGVTTRKRLKTGRR